MAEIKHVFFLNASSCCRSKEMACSTGLPNDTNIFGIGQDFATGYMPSRNKAREMGPLSWMLGYKWFDEKLRY